MTTRRAPRAHPCAVPNCTNPATLIVMLKDLYYAGTSYEIPFYEQDISLPFICRSCARKNEAGATGFGRYKGYPFSKWGAKPRTTGWTTYCDIKTKKEVVI
jgi:hypothetical protein